jgi:hypothetical protein
MAPGWQPFGEPQRPDPIGSSRAISFVIAAVTIGGVLAGVYATLAENHVVPNVTGLDCQKLANVSLRATPEAMQKITGVKADDSLSMRVPLSGCPYDAVTFDWDKAETTHAKSFVFYTGTPPKNQSAIVHNLQQVLGRRLEKGENFNWGGVYMNVSPTVLNGGTSITFAIKTPLDDKHWAERVDALWDVARSAALGLKVTVTEADRRDWLGGGYPLTALASLDMTTDVDGAPAMMDKAFPGTPSRIIAGLEYEVPIDHPWFSKASFDWPNEKGGRVGTVRIGAPPGAQYLPNQADVEKCIAATFGPGKVASEDHLAHTHATEFKLEDGSLRVDQYSVDVEVLSMMAQHLPKSEWKEMHVAPPMEHADWEKVMRTLDACGRR